MAEPESGRIIFVNGTSSAGKSTLCRALQDTLPTPFWHISSDHFIDAGMRPQKRIDAGDFLWREMRSRFFDGFHRVIPAFAAGGNDLLVEHIVEEAEWMEQLREVLEVFDVFVVSVRCSLDELAERERRRADRTIGEALFHVKTYTHVAHDLEIDSTFPASENAALVTRCWRERGQRRGFP